MKSKLCVFVFKNNIQINARASLQTASAQIAQVSDEDIQEYNEKNEQYVQESEPLSSHTDALEQSRHSIREALSFLTSHMNSRRIITQHEQFAEIVNDLEAIQIKLDHVFTN